MSYFPKIPADPREGPQAKALGHAESLTRVGGHARACIIKVPTSAQIMKAVSIKKPFG